MKNFTPEEQSARLRERLREFSAGGIALAYSGGVDSSLLLAEIAEILREKPFPFLALTMRSVFSPRAESVPAGIPQEILDVDPLSVPGLRTNPADRCYLCKRTFFSKFKEIARARGLQTLMDGTHADDLGEFRPGLRAARELGVVSPLAELGISKREVRAMAASLGLSCANKPSAPCLATRFPAGTTLTEKALAAADSGEKFLRRFLPGEAALRLRVHGELARIEVPPECFPEILKNRELIAERLSALGFRRVSLDLAGFRSGGMDEFRAGA